MCAFNFNPQQLKFAVIIETTEKVKLEEVKKLTSTDRGQRSYAEWGNRIFTISVYRGEGCSHTPIFGQILDRS